MSQGYYRPGLTTRELLEQFDVAVFCHLLYVELVKQTRETGGPEMSYVEARDFVDKRFKKIVLGVDESQEERAARIRSNAMALGRALKGG